MRILEPILLITATLGLVSFLFGLVAFWLLGAKHALRRGDGLDRAGVAIDVLEGRPGLGTAAVGFWHHLGTKDGSLFTYLSAGGLVLAFVTGVPGIWVSRINNQRAQEEKTRLVAANAQIDTGRRYLAEHFKAKGRHPLTLSDAYPPAQAPTVDPWGHPLRYELTRPELPFGFTLSSDGPDGAPGTEDDIGAR